MMHIGSQRVRRAARPACPSHSLRQSQQRWTPVLPLLPLARQDRSALPLRRMARTQRHPPAARHTERQAISGPLRWLLPAGALSDRCSAPLCVHACLHPPSPRLLPPRHPPHAAAGWEQRVGQGRDETWWRGRSCGRWADESRWRCWRAERREQWGCSRGRWSDQR